MSSVVIGIHGLANKPEKPILTEWWQKAIREGLSINCGVTDPMFIDQPYVEAAPGTLVKYDEGWLDGVRKLVEDAGGSVVDRVREYVGLDTASDWLLQQKFRDLAFYYDETRFIMDRNGQRRQARMVLMDELTDTLLPLKGQRMMVVAHPWDRLSLTMCSGIWVDGTEASLSTVS